MPTFAPVNSPGGSVDGFAASQGAWLIGLSVGTKAKRARVSRDRGQTWSEVALPTGTNASSGEFSGVVVGPDRAFYVAVRYPFALAPGVFGRLLRIDPVDGAVSIVTTLPAPDAGTALSAPAFDAQGRPWVAWVPGGSTTMTLARIAGGAAAETYQAPAPSTASANGEIQFRTSGMWVRMGNLVYRLVGGALVAAANGIPVFEEGSLMITESFMSLDGGQTFHRMPRIREVEGNPALLASDSRILRRYSPAMFSATAQSWSGNVIPLMTRVVATDGGVVVFSDEWREPRVISGSFRMLWHAGAVTDSPFSTGPLTETSTRWLTDANRLRAQAGLPPLLGDPAISTAAENHSRYWTMNAPTGSVLESHHETPGNPGFTGESPSARCEYAGAPPLCGEIMYSAGVANPISAWAATVFHSGLFMDPTSLAVGGGQVAGGPAVMNSASADGLLVGPVMFPRGNFSGPLVLANEYPDASAGCQSSGQGSGAGRPIFLWVPGGTVSGFTLTPAGGPPVRTCDVGHAFLPDGGLYYATTYTASVRWQPTPNTSAQQITWQFTTGASPVTPPFSPPPPATQPGPQSRPPAVPRPAALGTFPAKLHVLRAGIRGAKLDVRAQVTGRATGAVQVSYQSSGVTTRFSAPISHATISIDRRLPASQRRKTTGILTLSYRGNALVRPDAVRLRAASGKARLTLRTTLIDDSGRLRVSGTITERARGVVRIRLEHTTEQGGVEFVSHTAKIDHGKWSLTRALPAAVAKTGGQVSIQFTGYEARHIRGEQLAKAVTPR